LCIRLILPVFFHNAPCFDSPLPTGKCRHSR
jgi:hypothetical protein